MKADIHAVSKFHEKHMNTITIPWVINILKHVDKVHEYNRP